MVEDEVWCILSTQEILCTTKGVGQGGSHVSQDGQKKNYVDKAGSDLRILFLLPSSCSAED